MSRNKIIERREVLERELYQLEYQIKHFDNKLYPEGNGISQLTAWLYKRKEIREKLSMLPTVEDIQRRCRRVVASNSYTKEHKILLQQMRKLLEPDETKKGP